MRVITLTTDFGLEDAFAGIMKGVILGIAPEARIVDLCHGIPPQDVVAGALALESAVGVFPAGTIHVGVVDPGVGSERAAIAVRTARSIYVGPDNGLFQFALELDPMLEAVRLTNPTFHRPEVSTTFHGRDVFAPVAAHLALGATLESLGEPIESLTPLPVLKPIVEGDVMHLQVIHTDRFGNLITNLRQDIFRAWAGSGNDSVARFIVAGMEITGLARTYSSVVPGQPLAYFGSGGRLEISVRDGSARDVFGYSHGIGIDILLPKG